ncbi:DUF1883 domain-containing protein [Pantoea sp. GM01]|uniref:DUF1883 domain-containing protein n=1 Tax=Pantoea sp. GM01 TaxID=1144320 RepID=UPI000270FFD0|nr:DUF1883 domain-containing protein [Pantoea sp. GM01]EJL90229.1 Protein of unknown function (DUF1883) [Pantoea sp. GM01]
MSFLHDRNHLEKGTVVSVWCSHQINVLVMDDVNFNKYRRGDRCTTYGGFYKQFPANIQVPSTGAWNVVLALPPGHSAQIRQSIKYIT